MCFPCKSAGNKLTLARKMLEEPEALRILMDQAVAMHADCDYPDTCPCHHKVRIDNIINVERV